jgi:hypothetical protein
MRATYYTYITNGIGILVSLITTVYFFISFPSSIIPNSEPVSEIIKDIEGCGKVKEVALQLVERASFAEQCNILFMRITILFVVFSSVLFILNLILARSLKK